ncbi:MAG: hypothetical protein A3J80_04520 [Desulfobacula sp. RIFOXYB2_FULL_45_6]|nr:MAG: hypothetical protein A3J80_04520 [Desulfobacula sp. RIFOXYB2_FULL_45_6]
MRQFFFFIIAKKTGFGNVILETQGMNPTGIIISCRVSKPGENHHEKTFRNQRILVWCSAGFFYLIQKEYDIGL